MTTFASVLLAASAVFSWSVDLDVDNVATNVPLGAGKFSLLEIPKSEFAHPHGVKTATLLFDGTWWHLECEGHIDEDSVCAPLDHPAAPFPAGTRHFEKKELGDLQGWRPGGHNATLGDVAGIWYKDRLHVFYLADRRHHGSKGGAGGHFFAHVSTADLKTWREHAPAVPLTEWWQTVGTGTPFVLKDGRLALAYGFHTERMDKELAKGKPVGATYAISNDDGETFEPTGRFFHSTRNPTVFNRPDGRYGMVTGYHNEGGVYVSDDLENWTLVDNTTGKGGDCPCLFEWNGHHYLIQGYIGDERFLHSTTGKPGSWEDWSKDIPDLYAGLAVPMVVEIPGNRRLLMGWRPDRGPKGPLWGGAMEIRELKQAPDGRLSIVKEEVRSKSEEVNFDSFISLLTPPAEYAAFRHEVRLLSRHACPDFDVEIYEQANGPSTKQRVMMASDFGLGWTQTNWHDCWYWGEKLGKIRAQGLSQVDLLSQSGGKPFCLIAGAADDADSGLLMRSAKGYEGHPERLLFVHHGTGHSPPPEATEVGYRFLDSLFLLTSLQARPLSVTVQTVADHADAVYRCGEVAVFTAEAFGPDGQRMTNGLLKASVDNFGARTLAAERTIDLAKENPFCFRGSRATPGFLRLNVKAADESLKVVANRGQASYAFGVGYEPERIVPATPDPTDFDAFWADARRKLDATVPLDAQLELVPEKCNDTRNYYRVSFATAGGLRVYGWYSEPKALDKGPYPARVYVPGAGPGAGGTAGEDGTYFALTMNVHHYAVTTNAVESKRQHDACNAEAKKRYGVSSYATAGIHQSREDYYFYPTILGLWRAVEWLARRPGVNAKDVRYTGSSQGGAYGIILTSLYGRFAKSVVIVPAMTDLLGFRTEGRQPGWPRIVENQLPENQAAAERNAPYFCAVNFARRIRTPIRFVVGYADCVCPPHGVYAAYNVCPAADKAILPGIGMGHASYPELCDAVDRWQNGKQK